MYYIKLLSLNKSVLYKLFFVCLCISCFISRNLFSESVFQKDSLKISIDSSIIILNQSTYQDAVFNGGDFTEFIKWAEDNLNYSLFPLKKSYKTEVIVHLMINTFGNVEDVTILQGIDKVINNEVIRVVSNSPAWIPAKRNGTPMNQHLAFLFNFVNKKHDKYYDLKCPGNQAFGLAKEESAKFKNGDINTFRAWVIKNLKSPETIENNGAIEGKVIIGFVVNSYGFIDSVKILRGIEPNLDKEIAKIIMSSPQWTPGRVKWKYVNQQMGFVINFPVQ